ncbi:MAG TPA: DUF3891 family protein [Vicinamibacterales bacterium]
MIVRREHNRLLLITQPDHALLARRIMERCVPLATHPRRDIILHAIEQHDNGWLEEDAAPRVNPASGEIVDFVNAPADVRQRVWTRGVARLADVPWAAALVAQHAIVIYDRHHPDESWAPFFRTIHDMREEMCAASEYSVDELESDYRFVRLADLISLAFCMGLSGEQQWGRSSVRLSDSRVVVAPDMFGGVEIPIDIVARAITHQPFRSDHELRSTLSHAVPTTLRGSVSGPSAA